jgi:GDPmannose 4,6-dehydratase
MSGSCRALITGIGGQDGSYLADLLLSRPEYVVHGFVRPASTPNVGRIAHLIGDPQISERLFLHTCDLGDVSAVATMVEEIKPDEVYNLGAQSHVRVSFDLPLYTAGVTGLGALHLLDALRRLNRSHPVRYYQASSAEMFGATPPPQSVATPFHPRSPYGCAKLYAHWQTINYREAYGLFACSGILFNHESPRRGESFVTRKITLGAARIKEGLQKKLVMGNLDAKRDWGFAGDYVRAMWLMLQQEVPSDYIIATGQMYSIREFLDLAFGILDLDYREYVTFDPSYVRPAEVKALCGDSSPARHQLGWWPEVEFPALVRLMVEQDLESVRRQKHAQSSRR